jgi:major membrane immunogen (membrane-anchored lipoprotein)
MRSFRLAMWSVMVFAGLMVGLSMAQTSSLPGEIHSGKYLNAAFQMGRGLPYGTYQQTCRDVRMSGDRLQARCQKKDGGWRDTSMDYRSCRGSIINDDGNLRCGGGPSWQMGGGRGGYWQGGLPEGDYRRTCQNVRMNGDRLEARCQKRDGGWRDTSMDYRSCGGMVINDDGNLRCGGPGGPGGRMGEMGGGPGRMYRRFPEGDYRQTCQNVHTNGDRLEARCQKKDGGWRDTSIDYRRCRGTIANDDGNLRCR